MKRSKKFPGYESFTGKQRRGVVGEKLNLQYKISLANTGYGFCQCTERLNESKE